MLPIKLFRKAGANGHVFFLKNGHVDDKGLAYSGFIGLMTTVAVVPTTPQILNFEVEALTHDKQSVSVPGSITISFVPAVAVTKFDFTVDSHSGGSLGDWNKVLKALLVERVVRAVTQKVRAFPIEEVVLAQKEIEDAILAEIGDNKLSSEGLRVISTSIPEINPKDEDVSEAIGASQRQALLTEADTALHVRRIAASENDRAVKTFQAETDLNLENERSKLIEKQGENKKKEAEFDADATEARLKPLENIDGGKLLAVALMDGLKTNKIGSLSIDPAIVAAIRQHD